MEVATATAARDGIEEVGDFIVRLRAGNWSEFEGGRKAFANAATRAHYHDVIQPDVPDLRTDDHKRVVGGASYLLTTEVPLICQVIRRHRGDGENHWGSIGDALRERLRRNNGQFRRIHLGLPRQHDVAALPSEAVHR